MLAVCLSIIILIAQIGSLTGSFRDGINHITYSLEKRTYADPERFSGVNAVSLEANVFTVVKIYLKGTFFDLNNYFHTSNSFVSRYIFQVRYIYLIFLFGIVSVYLFALQYRYLGTHEKHAILTLILTTWYSILAPFSWYVSLKHIHSNIPI